MTIGTFITRNSTNILRTGCVLLLSTLCSTALKEASNETMRNLAADIRRMKHQYQERKMQHEEELSSS